MIPPQASGSWKWYRLRLVRAGLRWYHVHEPSARVGIISHNMRRTCKLMKGNILPNLSLPVLINHGLAINLQVPNLSDGLKLWSVKIIFFVKLVTCILIFEWFPVGWHQSREWVAHNDEALGWALIVLPWTQIPLAPGLSLLEVRGPVTFRCEETFSKS